MTPTVLRGARLADGRVVDVAIDPTAGTITSVTAPAERALHAFGANDIDLRGHVLLPSFAEPHAHLDKALTADLVPNLTGDLHGAITGWIDFLPTLTTEAIVERAVIALDELIASGVTTVRTHVNLDRATGMRALDALLEVRRRVGHRADLQIVVLFAFVGEQHEGWREQRSLVREAVASEPTLIVGGCPHIEADPLVATRFSVDLAAEFERPIDLHTDETLHESSLDVLHLADLARGWKHGTVVASHCVSLGMQPADDQRRIAARLAETGVHVVTLPQTNLFLQGRDSRTATPRGLTAIHALIEAGAGVCAGADNVRDPFNTMGRSDPLETAALLVMAGHLQPDEALRLVTAAPRAALGCAPVTLAAGSPADLVAVPGDSLIDAIARADQGRTVWHRGRMVARTTVQREQFG